MVKIVGERRLENKGDAVVFRTMSESRPGLFHYTVVLKSGGVMCSCEGFCMHGYCWHIDMVRLCNVPEEVVNAVEHLGHQEWDGSFKPTGRTCWYGEGHSGPHSWE